MRVRIPIKFKLALAIISLVVPFLLILSALFYWQFRKSIDERVLLQLSSIKQLKSVQIEDYLKQEWSVFVQEVQQSSDRGLPQDLDGDLRIIKDPESLPPADSLYYYLTKKNQIGLYDLSEYTDSGQLLLGYYFLEDDLAVAKILEAEKIQEILLERTGMGETGESYLVGSDFLLRSRSRFFPEKPPNSILAKTDGVRQALTGTNGSALIRDYRDVPVFSAFGRIDFKGIQWAILSELDQDEAHQPILVMQNRLVLILLLILILTILGAFLLARVLVKPLVRMKENLTGMASGNFPEVVIKDSRNDEIGDMFRALDQLVTSILQTLHFADEIGTMNLSAEYRMQSKNDRLGQALIAMQENLIALKKREEQMQLTAQKSLLQGQENERARLAREMHDGLGPLLTSLKMMIQRMTLDGAEKDRIKKILDDTISEVRRITYDLMPQALVDFGVAAALNHLVKVTAKASGIDIKYTYSMQGKPLSDQINTGIYRIAQEALNNALKHSGAREIRMSVTQFEDRISFYFEDDGRGFDTDHPGPGNGLVNMRERCRILNGIINIDSSPEGTVIEMEIPTDE
ncbi:MAG: HAMP domain-containing protein [Saprospiraceae bacterium]|nr:HAMP domain-containing protein [Saprospiraceae bacterium]